MSPSTGPAMAGAVKLVVAGGYGAGKTTLVTTLSDIDPITTESEISSFGLLADPGTAVSKTSTTVAFDFGRFAVTRNLMGYLFGLPGQSRFDFLWPDLVRGSFGGVVVVDPERCEQARPALEALRRHGVPTVVLVNSFDGLILTELDWIRDVVVRNGPEPIVAADVRDRAAVRSVMARLLRFAASRYEPVG